ncbi:hypothetical protein HYY72_01335 [Candidatus Woesearchaeota archaeon]|nr:hypothetical protein [Candidatus Woesearchaeota archaeon]
MNYEATIKTCADPELVYSAFLPDKKEMALERSEYTIKKTGGSVVFHVKAADAVALRATVNGITRMLAVIEKTKSA